MNFGLPEKTIKLVIDLFKEFSEINWVKVYGSRALGNFRKESDIDLVYSSNHDITAHLKEVLELLPTPYMFDITHYETIEHKNLKEHIDKVGKIIYINFQNTG